MPTDPIQFQIVVVEGTPFSSDFEYTPNRLMLVGAAVPVNVESNELQDIIAAVGGLIGSDSNKADLVNGVVPANQLPSYVDDVLEFANLAAFPVTGESGKIYYNIELSLMYRWTGSAYGVTSSSLALGTTETTAFRGDYGQAAYLHSQQQGNAHGLTATQIRAILGVSALSGSNTGDQDLSGKADIVSASQEVQMAKLLLVDNTQGGLGSLELGDGTLFFKDRDGLLIESTAGLTDLARVNSPNFTGNTTINGNLFLGTGGDGSGLKLKMSDGSYLRTFDPTNTGSPNSINFGAVGAGGDLRAHGQNFILLSNAGGEYGRFVAATGSLELDGGIDVVGKISQVDPYGQRYELAVGTAYGLLHNGLPVDGGVLKLGFGNGSSYICGGQQGGGLFHVFIGSTTVPKFTIFDSGVAAFANTVVAEELQCGGSDGTKIVTDTYGGMQVQAANGAPAIFSAAGFGTHNATMFMRDDQDSIGLNADKWIAWGSQTGNNNYFQGYVNLALGRVADGIATLRTAVNGPDLASLELQTLFVSDRIEFPNGSRLQQANNTAGIGWECSLGYVQNWIEGRLYTYDNDRYNISSVEHQFAAPLPTDNESLGYRIGSLWYTRDYRTFRLDEMYNWIDITPSPSNQESVDLLFSILLANASVIECDEENSLILTN